MANNENISSIRDEQRAGIDGREQERQRNQDQQDKTICIIEAIVLYELDHPCDSCVWRVPLPDYQPILDKNAPLERDIQKVFQETPADIAKAAIDEAFQMTEQGKTSTEINEALTKWLNKDARGAVENVLAIVRNTPNQLANVKAITQARWQHMKAIAEAVDQGISKCQEQVKRDTGKRPSCAKCQCLLIFRLRMELGLNYKSIGAIIGETEDNTRQKAHRCYLTMRPYFKRCHELRQE